MKSLSRSHSKRLSGRRSVLPRFLRAGRLPLSIVCASILFLSIAVLAQATATTTTVSSSPNPSVYGQTVTFTVTVTGVQTPSGTVTLKEGATSLGAKDLAVDGTPTVPGTIEVTFNVSTLSVGSHTINAEYGGSVTYSYDASSGSLFHTVNKDDTTTAVSSSNNTSPYPVTGEDITFTATVTANTSSEIPTGGVTFYADGNVIGSGLPLNGSGVATCTAAFNAVDSTVDITASYGGDSNYNGSSTASALVQVVELADTTTTVSSSKNTSGNYPVTGESVTFTATVEADTPGTGTPTGDVTFTFTPAAVSPQTVTLNNGQAEYTTSMLKASNSTYSVACVYNADANYNGSTASALTQTVNMADTVIVITGDDPDPSIEGEAYTVTWSISVSAPGSDTPGTPTGDVTVDDGDSNTCVKAWETDDNCDITSALAGSKTLTANYDGDGDFVESDTTASHMVSTADTSVVVTSTPNPSDIGATVTFTATVTADAPGAATPTGTVEFFYDDGTTPPTPNWVSMTGSTANPATLSGGTATFACASLAAGDWDIKAEYVAAGGSLFNDSTSNVYTQTVNKLDLTLTIADSPATSVVGQEYTVTWSTSPSTTGGAVTVSDGTGSCTGTCTTGVSVESGATGCSLASTTVGLKTLTATYAGNATYNPATDTEPHQVNQGTVSIDIDPVNDCSSLTPITTWTSGDSGCFTATVAAAGDASGTPTGTVTFHIEDAYGVTIDNSGPHLLSSGSACSDSVTLTDSQSVVTVTVSYSGDASFASASTAPADLNTDHDQVVAAAALTGFVIDSDTPDPSNVTQNIQVSWRADAPFADGSTVTVTLYDENGVTTGVTCQQTYGTDNTLSTGSCTLLAGGAMPAGNMTLVAEYSVGPASTPLEPHTVVAYTTTTVVALAPSTVYVNEPTTITATVEAASAGPGLSGRVVGFTTVSLPAGADGDFSSDYCTLSGSVLVDLSTEASSCSNVTYTPTAASADSQSITIQATFSTDAPYLGSSNTSTLTVDKRPASVSVVCAPDSVYIDQETTCTVTVSDGSGASGSTIPSGTVTLNNGSEDGVFSPTDSGSLTLGTYDVTYTPAAGDAGTSAATPPWPDTTIEAVYGGSPVYTTGASTATNNLEVMLRPTETTLTWEDSLGGNETLYLGETGQVIVTVTDIGPANSASPPQGTLNVTAPAALVSSLTPISANASQAIYSFKKTTSTEPHMFVPVTATYTPVNPQTHDGSDGSVDVPVQKRDTETALVCSDVSPYTCTATVTDTSPRGTPSAPGGRIVDQGDNTEYCSSTTVTGPATSTCAKDYPGTAMMEPVAAGYEPGDDIHKASYGMDMIERPLVPDGACGTLHIEDTIFGLNTTCTVMAALQVLLESGATAASILVDPVWTAIFPGSTVPVGDMIAGGLTGLSLHGEIAIQAMCTDVDGDGIPGSVEAVIAGLEDHHWDSDGDGMGDLDEIDEASGDLATSYTASTDYSSCACPNPTVADSDGDGLLDGQENGFYPTSFCDPDSDDDLLTDKQEVDTWDPAVFPDVRDRADPLRADTDGDGLRDDKEFYSNSCPFINDDDSDDDGLQDGTEDWNHSGTIETGTIGDTGTRGPASVAGASGETHFCNPDTDGDGLTDGEEFALFGGLRPDPDVGQGFIDVSVTSLAQSATIPALDMDSDDDGLSDYEEVHVTQTDPLDWDTDDDTISDLNELIATGGAWPQRAFKQVSDPLDPDTDDDDLLDNIEYSGTQLGTSHGIGGTDDLLCPFVNDDDSDDDGLQDGTEGWSGDGSITTGAIGDSTTQAKISPTTGETHFCNPDTDGDGLTDGEEVALLGGLPVSSTTGFTTVIPLRVSTVFGVDVAPVAGDATVPALDDDSDNDGLSDYEEVNITGTDPLDADTDNDTISDANELLCTGGTWPKRTFQQESDPLDPDTDDDDLYDQIEYTGTGMPLRATGGTPDIICPYVNDDDSDDDGLQDGTEDANHDGTWGDSTVLGGGITVGSFGTQSIKDGAVGPWECDLCNPDSDGDGLLDGEEVGLIGGGPTGAGATRPTTGFDEVAPDKASETLPMGDVTSPAGASPGTGNLFLGPYTFSPTPDGTIDATVPALDVDSDNDGLSDYEEVNITGTDPLDQDTDNDTLMDADELIATGGTPDTPGNPGTGPRRTFDQESDPLDINTDDDHLFDPQEYYLSGGQYGSGLSLLAGATGGTRDAVCPFVNDDDSDNDGIQDGAVVTIDPALTVTGTLNPPGNYDYSYTHYEDFVDVGDASLAFPGEAKSNVGAFDGEQRNDLTQNVCDSDSDGDGLNDGEEIAIGTNPDDCDTDDDGRNDWHEVTGGGPIPTDPFDPDTDDDGLLDSAEVFGSNPTNPVNADTDGDGLCDGGTRTPWMTNNPLDPRVVVNPICKSCSTPGFTPCATPLSRLGSPDGIGDHPNPLGIGEDEDGWGDWSSGETDPNQYDTDGDALADGIERLSFSTTRQQMIPTADIFGRPILVVYPEANNVKSVCDCLDPLDPDSDNDGLSDGYEDRNHDGNFDFLPSEFDHQDPLPGPPIPYPTETNPCDSDTDHDGLTDWEERYQRQPLDVHFSPLPIDNDGDGAFDEDPVDGIDNDLDGAIDEDPTEEPIELTFNPTNPLDHDTDNDRLTDGYEVKYVCVAVTYTQLDNDGDALIDEDPVDGIDNDLDGLIDEDDVDFYVWFVPMLDPTNRDSDSDGWIDGLDSDPCNSELIPILQPVQIEPIDSDGDGFADDDELVAGTHPNDPEDYPTAYCMVDLDFDQEIDDRMWLEPSICCGIANSVAIDIDSNVLIDARVQIVAPRDVKQGDFDGDGAEDDYRYVIEYAFSNYRVLQPRIVATIDDYNGDLVIDHAEVVRK